MSVLLQLSDAHKRYGELSLLDGAEVALTDDKKIGLVGRNGAGKSTLCRILLGEEELDAGEVIRSRGLRLGYLRQHDPFLPGETVLGFLMRESDRPDWRCGEVAWQFEIKGDMLSRPVAELSGGWQTRVKLSGLLLCDPNLLLLDEPTNFLDLRTQIMLEHFLRAFPAGALIVSHDRTFLRSTCRNTLELSRGRLTLFPGDVDAYFEQQQQQRLHDERVNETIRAKRRQLQTFIDKNRGSPKTSSQARSKAKQMERLQVKHLEGPESLVRIRVPDVDPRKGIALRCRDLAIGYPDHRVAEHINLDVEHGARLAVVGDNGQGKTTFLRSVVDSLPPLAGEVRWGHGCELGVYAQHVYASLPAKSTILEYLTDQATFDTRTQTILDVAGSFLFRAGDVEKRIAVLSGGERARLCLAGLLLGRHNVLVLDEPANHLDVETLEGLADALCDYRGTVLLTSHDRSFIQRVATGVIEVQGGRVANYPGDYDAYVYRVGKEVDEGTRVTSTAGSKPRPAQPSRASVADRDEDRKERNRLERERKRELAALERKIARLDQEKKTLHAQLMSATDPREAQRLHAELSSLAEQLAPIEQQWLSLAEQTEEGEAR